MQQIINEIMSEIKAGFVGDTEKDILYLQQKMDEYQNHEKANEIIKECSRLLYDMATSAEKCNKEEEQLDEIKKHMKEIRVYIDQNDIESALRVSKTLVERVDANSSYIDNERCEYYSFSEFFEEILVKEFMQSGREIVKVDIPFSDIYYQHGLLLLGMGKPKEARKLFEKARRWNPVNAAIAFAYIETFRATGEWEEYVETNREIFPYLFRATDVAKCFCNFGEYFLQKEEESVAAGCYQLSLQYMPDNAPAKEQLDKINVKAPTLDEMKTLAKQNGFFAEPNANIVNLCVGLGEQFMNQQVFDGAMYCFEIVYGLTRDEKIGELVKQMQILIQ